MWSAKVTCLTVYIHTRVQSRYFIRVLRVNNEHFPWTVSDKWFTVILVLYSCYHFKLTSLLYVRWTFDRSKFWKLRLSGGSHDDNQGVWQCTGTTEIADDVSLKKTFWGSKSYWNNCSEYTDDKYTFAFQIYARINEKMLDSYINRKYTLLWSYAHVHIDHMIEGSSG